MGYNIDATHHRYYVYRVVNPGAESVVKYRTSNGEWRDEYEKAMLWSDHDAAVKKATECAKLIQRMPDAFPGGAHINVGRVTVLLDSMFSIETIKINAM